MDQEKIRHYLSNIDLFKEIQSEELDRIIDDAFF